MISVFDTNPSYSHYYPVLYRYARLLIKDHATAIEMAHNVLADQYDIDWLTPSEVLRITLMTDIKQRCFVFNKSKVFDRPQIKIPFT
ncbi:hypothetical protein [Ferruginibacter sp.]